MNLPVISGRTFALIGGATIAAAGYAGHVVGQTKDDDAKAPSDNLGRNMLIGAGVLGTANLGAMLLPKSPMMLLAAGAGALAGAAYTFGESHGRSSVLPT